MHDLVPTTALANKEPQRDHIGNVTITEVPDLALASVAARLGQEAHCARILANTLGTPPPDAGKAAQGNLMAAFWIGADQWMVSAPMESHELLCDLLKTDLETTASVTEQSDAWVCFDMRGEGVVDILERLCPVPARRMAVGDAQRTIIHHLGCFVICVTKGNDMRVLGPRSSAASLHHAVCTAAHAVA